MGPMADFHWAVKTVVPLVFSIQAAFSLAPDDEQTLELIPMIRRRFLGHSGSARGP